MRGPNAILTTVVLAAAAGPALAQLGDYVVPGSLAESRRTERERVVEDEQEARWDLGAIKVDPRISLEDVGFVNNVFDVTDDDGQDISDFKATAILGLDGYVHVGPKVLVHAFGFGSYHWWQEEDGLRELNGSAGLALYGLFNRFQFDLQVGRIERQRNLSTDLEAPVQLERERAAVSFDVDFRGPFGVFGSAVTERNRFDRELEERVPGLDLATLDNDTELLNAGLSYTLDGGLRLGLGFETTETDFENDPGGRSNSSSGPLLRADYNGNRIDLTLAAALRTLDFDAERDREEFTGNARVRWRVGDRTDLTVYGSQQLLYSALDSETVLEGERAGLALGRSFSDRIQVVVFGETGEDVHSTPVAEAVRRLDDFESFGGWINYALAGELELRVGIIQTERDSTLPEFDRDLTTILSSISLGDDLLPW